VRRIIRVVIGERFVAGEPHAGAQLRRIVAAARWFGTEHLIGQRTATISRLLWRLHELDPEHIIGPAALAYRIHSNNTAEWFKDRACLC
jgi:hypothetical protein